MNPQNDIVCSILQTPFSRWSECDKRDVLLTKRPTPILNLSAQKVEQKGVKRYKKHFKSSWYTDYEWLCGSSYMEKLFCWACLLLGIKQTVWNSAGFCDILNINRSLHKHSDSAEHLKCALKLKQLERNQNIVADALKENNRLYVSQYNETVRLNRLVFKVLINAILYLTRQELAFRDHDESSTSSNRENFKELLSLLILTSPLEIQTHYNKIKSIFTEDLKTAQNEIIDCISEYIDYYIKQEICNSDFFSVQIDDITEITNKSQCSVIVRLVDNNGELIERFLGLFDVSCDRTTDALFALVDSVLQSFDYQSKLIGQCYDGASIMSGHLNGLQKKVKDFAPQAVFVHCLEHRLNLVLQSTLKQISQCRIFFADIAGIPSLFHHSPKRNYALDAVVGRRIPATDSRWSSYSTLLKVVEENWNDLVKVFQEIADDFESDQISVRLSNKLLSNMNDFEFTFLVTVFNKIFQITGLLFGILQNNSLDIVFCQKQIENSCDILQRERTDEVFVNFFETAKQRGEFSGRKYAKLSQDELFQKYKLLYFEILDLIMAQITIRFQDLEKLRFFTLADSSRFLQHSTIFPIDALTFLQETYPDLFKISRLKTELEIFYGNEEYQHNVPITQTLKLVQGSNNIFQQVYKLFSLVVTLPSVSVKRSCSALKRLKAYLRSSVTQERLTSLASISIHKDLLNDLEEKQPFLDDIIDKYASKKDRRVDLIYKK